MTIGDKVQVAIPYNRQQIYTQPAYAALQGRKGTITEDRTQTERRGSEFDFLVQFDDIAPAFYSNGQPHKCFLFSKLDLTGR